MDYQVENLILRFVKEDDLSEVARMWPADHHPLSNKEAMEAIAYMSGNYARNTKGSIYHLCLAFANQIILDTLWAGADWMVAGTIRSQKSLFCWTNHTVAKVMVRCV